MPAYYTTTYYRGQYQKYQPEAVSKKLSLRLSQLYRQWRTGPPTHRPVAGGPPQNLAKSGPFLLKRIPFCKNILESFRVSKQSTTTGETLSPP